MAERLELQALLESILGSREVYFQPPYNLKLQYPCIIYDRANADSKFAGNMLYSYTTRYKVTVIDRDPDSSIPFQIANIPMCLYDRFYTSDNLNHDVFTLFF